ncbi:MAG: MFS transporter [Rhodoferax sp.]|uniref:MFS transporter n=1 Tax=Rhodoferax sp. TaxID=50421 RepID=UPI0026355AB5|nr:MFS transporter [Rhodoferax sp.]MDD5335201.1 MFS transporter [Rhodoferax sp.]
MSVVFYKNMGLSNTDIALYTSWLYLPFVIKPLWSPFVDMFRTKRWWILTMQLLIGSGFALVALVIPLASYFQLTLAIFWLLAFSAATHDVASDGFYMLSLKQHQQAAYVGVRSMFFRMAMLTGQGALVFLAGRLTELTGNTAFAWSLVFFVLAAMFIALFVYHRLVLPTPAADHALAGDGHVGVAFLLVFREFLAKKNIGRVLAFLLLYRFGESQLVKLAPPFLLDSKASGGLALSTAQVGIVYGSIGMVALTVGGLLGSYLIARDGLKRWLWPMALAINVPHLVYVYLALALPGNLYLIGAAVAFEQLGYGFGFTAYVLFMIMTADGGRRTQDRALRHLRRLHGHGHDAARHVQRLAASGPGLCQFFHLGVRCRASLFCCHGLDRSGSPIWQGRAMKYCWMGLRPVPVTIRSRWFFALVLLTALMTDFCAAQSIAPQAPGAVSVGQLNAELKAVLDDPLKPLASLSAVAICDGKVVYEGHFGYRFIDNAMPARNLTTDTQTLYRVASLSKLVTAIGVMRLVEQNKLDLDADIGSYLGFRVRNPNFPDARISTRMLLNHTSSLRDGGGYSFPLEQSLQSVLDPAGENYGSGRQWAAVDSSGDRAPGKYFQYVNLNWGLLGTVMEAVSGQRFDRYTRQAVLSPLQIPGNFNTEELSASEIRNLAVLYRKRRNEVWDPTGPWVAEIDDYQGKPPAPRAGMERYRPGRNATPFSPQGGLRIGAAGLAKLMLLLINGGEVDGVRLLSQDSIAAMLHEEWRHDENKQNGDNYKGLFNAWGLGVQRFLDLSAPQRGDRLVAGGGVSGYGHLGFAYGLQSAFFFDPVKRFGMIYLMGGTGFDPESDPGRYSSLNSWEERVLDALYRHAILKEP